MAEGGSMLVKLTSSSVDEPSNQPIHFYDVGDCSHLALFLDPINENFGDKAQVWEFSPEGKIAIDVFGEQWCIEGTTIRRLDDIVIPTLNQRRTFAIYCALEVYRGPTFVKWAENWLSGKNRTKQARVMVAMKTKSAVYAAATWAVWAAKEEEEALVARFAARAAQRAREASNGRIDLAMHAKKAMATA